MDEESLKGLRTLAFLGDWAPSVAASDIADVRRILTKALDELIVLGPTSSSDQRLDVLRSAVTGLNALDYTFICSLEREDLVDHFFSLGTAAEIGEDSIDEAVEHREWKLPRGHTPADHP
jgi:hypothetical protein